MNKAVKFTFLIITILALFGLCSCIPAEAKQEETATTSMFVCLETSSAWKVVYHKNTKVMYAVSYSSYNRGNFTLLVNSDGTPMIYGGNDE